jgi:hypothetical protein
MGENLKVVWAEFSTLSLVVLLSKNAAATSRVENSAQGSSCQLKFVHGPTFAAKSSVKF